MLLNRAASVRPTRLTRVTYSLAELQNTSDIPEMPLIGTVTMQTSDISAFNRPLYNREIDLESALHIGLLIVIGLVQVLATYSLATWLSR